MLLTTVKFILFKENVLFFLIGLFSYFIKAHYIYFVKSATYKLGDGFDIMSSRPLTLTLFHNAITH